jgi:hypothetical protein
LADEKKKRVLITSFIRTEDRCLRRRVAAAAGEEHSIKTCKNGSVTRQRPTKERARFPADFVVTIKRPQWQYFFRPRQAWSLMSRTWIYLKDLAENKQNRSKNEQSTLTE